MRALLMTLLMLTLPAAMAAHPAGRAGDVEVVDAWARATPPGAQNGAVYLTIRNTGKTAERLLGAASDRAERTELHTSETRNGVATMVQLSAVDLPAGETVRFEPGGRHVMLVGLRQPLKAGERIALTLRLERAGELKLELPVKAAGAMGHGHHRH